MILIGILEILENYSFNINIFAQIGFVYQTKMEFSKVDSLITDIFTFGEMDFIIMLKLLPH